MSDRTGVPGGATIDAAPETGGGDCPLRRLSRGEIVAGVCACLGAVLDRDAAGIREEDRIIEDLGADSLDLLDLLFQLERRFAIKISPRDIERRAQAALGETPLQVDGVYTPEALAALRASLPEVPEAELSGNVRAVELPRRFRVGTFATLVGRFLEEQHA
jgi:acyl carrier protein